MKKLFCLIITALMMLSACSVLAEAETKVLVVYFSATGTTQEVAERIASLTGADIFRLEPVVPYTDADLNWRDSNSKCWNTYIR